MTDTTIKKVQSDHSPQGTDGQRYLVSGKGVAMRLWNKEADAGNDATIRDYETVGYVISGSAVLELKGQEVALEPGDSWLVPAGASHRYRIEETFKAVEATAPPAQVHGRE